MKQTPPEYRASRSLALALPYAAFLGLPRKAVAEVAASSRRAVRDCRSSVKRFAASALNRRKARAESPPCKRRVEIVRSAGDMVDPVAIEAAIAERARCARIVRRGIELGVGPHAAALAFQTSLNPDAAIALVDRLASISNVAKTEVQT